MLKHVELDPTFGLQQQFADTTDETTILINLFDVDPADQKHFKAAWLTDAKFFAAQPGYISAQLHQGVEGSGRPSGRPSFCSRCSPSLVEASPPR